VPALEATRDLLEVKDTSVSLSVQSYALQMEGIPFGGFVGLALRASPAGRSKIATHSVRFGPFRPANRQIGGDCMFLLGGASIGLTRIAHPYQPDVKDDTLPLMTMGR
jgi:hypothetical protein